MSTYRDAPPQLGSHIFLSDGGMETTLIFRASKLVSRPSVDNRSEATDWPQANTGAGFWTSRGGAIIAAAQSLYFSWFSSGRGICLFSVGGTVPAC